VFNKTLFFKSKSYPHFQGILKKMLGTYVVADSFLLKLLREVLNRCFIVNKGHYDNTCKDLTYSMNRCYITCFLFTVISKVIYMYNKL
jgi:hypothetical protein